MANVPVIVWALDRDGVFVLSEGKDLALIGLQPGEVVGKSVFDLYGDVPMIVDSIRKALDGESTSQTVDVDGVMLTSWYSPLRNLQGEVVGMVGVAVDVTEQERVKADLLMERRLLAEMLHSHERDRKLTAYEIHDGLVQEMTGALMYLESLVASGRLPEGPCRDEVETALGLVRSAVGESRRVINGLRPPILDELGIVAAVEHLIASQPAGGPQIELSADVEFERLEPLLEGTVYRIVQEAITNVRRHSRSDRAEVRLVQTAERLKVEVSDRGVGFDPARVGEKRYGLQGIRERARLLHGRASIDSAPGKGTRVLADLPMAGTPN